MTNKPKTLARHGSLDEYVDSLPAHDRNPIEDKVRIVTEIRQCERWIDRRDNVVMVLNVRDFDVTFETSDGGVRTMSKEKFLKEYRFIEIQWDMGTDEKSETILVTVCSKCGSTVPADSVDSLALSKLKADGYQDWLKRRNRMNGEIMYYKRYQMELLKKYSYILVGLMGFLYLVLS